MGYADDEEGGIPVTTEYLQAEQRKVSKLAELTEYDDSDAVNSFTVNGITMRLRLDLRMKLRNIIDTKKRLGESGDFTQFYEGQEFTFPLSSWDYMLNTYENYAYQVFCVTERHKAAINALTTAEEVEAYDFTTGYPEILHL